MPSASLLRWAAVCSASSYSLAHDLSMVVDALTRRGAGPVGPPRDAKEEKEENFCLRGHGHTQAAERPRVELADARLRDGEHPADLLQGALLEVIQAQQMLLTLGQQAQGRAHRVLHVVRFQG